VTASDPPALSIEPVSIAERLRTRAGPTRLAQERRYGRALAKQIAARRPDVVLSVPSSLDGQRAALRASRESGAAFVFWLQDIYSQAIGRLIGKRVPVGGPALSRWFARMEGSLLRGSDAVVAISEDFRPHLDAWRVPADRVTIQPNWAPLDDVTPMPKSNLWSEVHGLDRFPIFLYSGTLGRKHDPGLLVALADAVPDARVVVVAEGTGVEPLRAAGRTRPNLMLLPLQPIERLPEVLATADVLVALLEPDASVFSVPSKVLTYLTAGRAILAAIPSVNQAARTIAKADAGQVAEPGDAGWFTRAGRSLMDDSAGREAAGRAGREFAEENFEIGPIADRFERVLEAAAEHRRARGTP
jgi:glycosyltransferase involved in cell wall biosynthesis